MLDWFNALILIFSEFVSMFFDLPFYVVSVGFILLAVVIVHILLKNLIK